MSVLHNIFFFIVAIGVLVTFHEFGHYWVARKLGVKVLRFSVGFGKPLLSWTRKNDKDKVEYVIMVRVDEPKIGGYAGTVAAAPIFAEISNFIIDNQQIQPAP